MSHRNALILLFLIMTGAAGGVVFGWFFGEQAKAISWLGTLFLNALKMTIIPLIIASVISGIGGLGNIAKLGRLGGFTLIYYLGTSALAVLIGLIVVNLIQPGQGMRLGNAELPESILAKQDTGLADIFLSLISPNLFASAADMQLLPLIVFAVLFATALGLSGDQGQPAFRFFDAVNAAMMRLVGWIMVFAPVGIFALIAARIGEAGGGAQLAAEMRAVGLHVVTVISGLGLHFIALFLILRIMTGRGLDYLSGMGRALITAFGTASSSATLPLTMTNALENRVDEKSVKFVLPLGSTVNMDGTALYEAAAVMFIAQAYGLDMSLTQQAIIFITATLAAIGAAGIPEAGLVTMVIVLTAVGLPLEGIALLLSVDWFLDRFRTTVNVWGDSVGAAVIDHRVLRR